MNIVGHRGARGLFPENTLYGFKQAIDLGIKSFELDVLITKDDMLVVSHDTHLNPDITRDYNGNFLEQQGPLIRSLTYSELRQYDVGIIKPDSDYAIRFPEQQRVDFERIPCLIDVLALIHEHNLHATLEVKSFPKNPDWTTTPERYAIQLRRAIGLTGTSQHVTISSFDYRIINAVRYIIPDVLTTGLTEGPVTESAIRFIAYGLGSTGWSPDHTTIDQPLVSLAHSLGLSVIPYTVNDIDDIARMQNLGVDGIITDYPNYDLKGTV